MKILCFTDLHLHKWSDFSTPTPDGGNTRLNDGLSVFDKVGDIAIKEKVDLIVFNGDLFHRRGLIDILVFNRAYIAITQLAERVTAHRIRIILIAGNHDQASRVSGMPSTAIYAFSSIPGVTVHLSTAIDTEYGLGFIPYAEAKEDVAAAFKQLRKCEVIFFHGGISGAATGPLEYQPKEELTVDDLPTKPFIFCGHYHKRQQLRDTVWYVGSPMQHCRGDAGDTDKGCVVVDFSYDLPKFKWFNFDFPQFLTRTYPDVEGIEGNFVDVQFDPDTVTPADVVRTYKKARSAQHTPMISVNDKTARNRIKVDATFDYDKLMSRYVKKFNKDLTADKLLAIGKELLGDVHV